MLEVLTGAGKLWLGKVERKMIQDLLKIAIRGWKEQSCFPPDIQYVFEGDWSFTQKQRFSRLAIDNR
jgi:hypothetical protein